MGKLSNSRAEFDTVYAQADGSGKPMAILNRVGQSECITCRAIGCTEEGNFERNSSVVLSASFAFVG